MELRSSKEERIKARGRMERGKGRNSEEITKIIGKVENRKRICTRSKVSIRKQ